MTRRLPPTPTMGLVEVIVFACLLTAQSFQQPLRSICRLRTSSPQQQKASKVVVHLWGPAYCEQCGCPTTVKIPEGDERERHVCSDTKCSHIHYQNPKVVVGVVCTYKDEVLLCQRAIEPCVGLWGYPQGFLELGETTRQGAARETWEEAGVRFDPTKAQLLSLFNLAGMQVQTIYRVELDNKTFEAGHESSDVKFVAWDDIPWNELAFPTVKWGLEHARDMQGEKNPTVQERTKLVTMDGKWEVTND